MTTIDNSHRTLIDMQNKIDKIVLTTHEQNKIVSENTVKINTLLNEHDELTHNIQTLESELNDLNNIMIKNTLLGGIQIIAIVIVTYLIF